MNILIAQTSFLGDVVLTTPLMVALKEQFPNSKFTWVVTPQAAPLLKHDPWIAQVITFDKNKSERSLGALISKSKEISSHQFDLALGVQRSWRTSLLLRLGKIQRRHGFKNAGLRWLYSQTFPRSRTLEHEVLRNLSLLNEVRSFQIRIVPKSGAIGVERAAQLDPSKCVVLGVGSAWATKRWTLGGFIALAKAVTQRGLIPVILGSAEDQARADIVAEECQSAVNLQLPLDDSVAFINRCAAVVCHDSLLLHLASAFKKPTVAIFCSTVPSFGFGPWLNPNACVVEEAELACKPCGRHGHQFCPTETWACSIGISPQKVIKALDSVLSS